MSEENKVEEVQEETKVEVEQKGFAKVTANDLEFKQIPIENVDVVLPGGNQKELLETRVRFPQDLQDADNATDATYAQAIQLGAQVRTYNDILHGAVEGEKGAGWDQVVDTESGPIGAIKPRFKDSAVKMTGTRAVMRMRSLLGKGGQITIPLYHSGFWATFNSPDEDAILAFHNRISQDKTVLGRKLFGSSLANENVYTNKSVIDFALDHLIDTNLTSGKDGFVEALSALDMQHVAWGLACAMYPNGFDFARAVITDNPEDRIIQTGKVNVTKLQRTHAGSLTDKQKRHMANRNQRVSKESLELYKAEFNKGQPRELVLSDNIKVTLRVPTLLQHLDAGMYWVDGITDLIDNSFTITGGTQERNNYIMRQSKATQMRQFDHWVKDISILNPYSGEWELNERDEEDTVELMLAENSSDDELRKKFFEGVREYMNDSTVSLIAVTTGSPQENELALPRFEELFPIDVVAVFITLLTRRVEAVDVRSYL